MFTNAITMMLKIINEHNWCFPEDPYYDDDFEGSFEDMLDNIESLGYHLIGTGFYSSVWSIPHQPKLVLKISHREEDPAREYMAWCLNNPHPAAPRILTYQEIGHFCVVTMPRYQKVDHQPLTRPPAEAVLNFEREPDWDKPEEVLAATIRDLFPYHCVDLHWSNIMRDHRGQLILTDPFSEDM